MNTSPHGADAESPRTLDEGESEAVTVTFAEADASVCGVARVGRALVDGELRTSGLGMLFAEGEPIAVRAESALPVAGSDIWGEAAAAGVETEVIEPLLRWSVTFTDEEGRNGFDLELQATSEPAELGNDTAAARLGGMTGYDQLLTARGSVTVDGSDRAFSGLGQRGHSWGRPDWSRLSMARTIGVWLGDGHGASLTAIRPADAKSHAEEAALASVFDPVAGGVIQLTGPRISTTYDGEGRQHAAGLELWLSEDDDSEPVRISGDAACGTTLDLGTLRLQCAFFRWSDGERSGVGRYDVLAARACAQGQGPEH